MAISEDEVIGVQYFLGSIKGFDFAQFLIELINNNETIRLNIDNYYFYIDNTRIHYALKI